jgi:alkanesulfonate monooxygenase SsuD/methylene tetrahydromethanopterin reductase-like flavin-dependent oxidoreductase (luciferase family)
MTPQVRCSTGVMLPITPELGATDLIRIARRAEEAGLDAVACGEHAVGDVVALLAAIGQATERIRFETAVVTMHARSAASTAMAATTLADIGAGRFGLGLGAGSPTVAGWHGRDFDRPLAAMRSFVVAVRDTLQGRSARSTTRFRLLRPPTDRIPVVVAAANPRMMSLAAESADGILLNFTTAAQLRPLVQQWHEARVGRDPFRVMVIQWVWTGRDRSAARAAFARQIAPYLAVPGYARAAAEIVDRERIDAVGAAWRTGGRTGAAELVPPELVDALLVVGGRAEIERRVDELAAAGCTDVRLLPLHQEGSALRNASDLVEEMAQ